MSLDDDKKFDFVIVGGGIAGTVCAQRLSSIATNDIRILLISASPLVKAVSNFKSVTKFLNTFDIEEKKSEAFGNEYKNLTIVNKYVQDLKSSQHKIICSDGTIYEYGKLCICTGATPKLIKECDEFILGIRDMETIETFQTRLANARQIVLVGNGGIATELAYEIENCKVIWAIKDDHISNVYFDAHASKFFEKRINETKAKGDEKLPAKRVPMFGDYELKAFSEALFNMKKT